MKKLIVLIALFAGAAHAGSTPKLPIQSGRYTFQHRSAEHPGIKGISLTAEVKGAHIVLTNHSASDVFPMGVVAEGTLMWHPKSKQWIIGSDPADSRAEEVGGCSDGPEVVDLRKLTYWTC